MCYLESNKSRGGEVSRKVIKRKKMKSFAKQMRLISVATPSALDLTTLQSAGSLPLVLDIVVVKTGKNTSGRREVSRSRNSFVCNNEL